MTRPEAGKGAGGVTLAALHAAWTEARAQRASLLNCHAHPSSREYQRKSTRARLAEEKFSHLMNLIGTDLRSQED